MKLIPEQEIVFSKIEPALDVITRLSEEGYVCMLSREDDLYVVNYIWSTNYSDRNDVVFMYIYDFESKFVEIESEDIED